MALYKGYRVQIVDSNKPDANIIKDLGNFAFSVMTFKANPTSGVKKDPSFINDYIHETYKDLSGVHSISNKGSDYDSYFSFLQTFAPLALSFDISGYEGYMLRYYNASGYYCVSGALPSGSFSGYMALYKPDGTPLAGHLYLGYSGSANASNISFAICDIDGETITNLRSVATYKCNSTNYIDTQFYTNYSSPQKDGVIEFLNNSEQYVPEPNDPYTGGGETGTGGGTGTFDGTGDNVDFPSLPTLSSVDTGFISLYNPSIAQLKELSNYLWGDLFDISTWKKIFADPMDAILGMSIVPVAVPDGSLVEVTVGNIGTGVFMTKAGSQYVEIDCGTLNVEEYWGAYLDYDPYTKAEIYLPYIGTHPLSVDDIMNKSVHVKYHVDILSGSCCAYVKCGGSVMYSFVGQCSCSVPITGNDWTNVINGALSIAASIGTMVATGGASAPMAAATIASTAVNSMKPNVEKSGSMGGMGGMLGVQTPYLILTRPRQALPARQNTFTGYPSFITMSLGDCSGYTEVESVHLENVPATGPELSEIENLLKEGVIL